MQPTLAACAAAVLTMATMVAAQPPLPPRGVSSSCSASLTRMASSMLPAWKEWVSGIPETACLTRCIPDGASPKPGQSVNCPCFGAPGNNNMDTANYISACQGSDGYWLNKNTDLVWGAQYTCNGNKTTCPMYTEAISCMPRDCTASDVALVGAMETKALCARMVPYDLSSCAVKYVTPNNDDGDDDPEPRRTIMDIANNHPDLSTLAAALKAGGLVGTLSGPGPFTVLTPTNEAFAALPPATLKSLLNPANKPALVKVLTYHVIAKNIQFANLTYPWPSTDGKRIKTANGANVTCRNVNRDDIVIQGGTRDNLAKTVNGQDVRKINVEASNGVVHFVNAVLIPPAAIDALLPRYQTAVATENNADGTKIVTNTVTKSDGYTTASNVFFSAGGNVANMTRSQGRHLLFGPGCHNDACGICPKSCGCPSGKCRCVCGCTGACACC